MSTKHWNPDMVDTIVGVAPMSGFAEDGMITFVETGERFLVVVGVDGQVTRSKVVARIGKLTIKLMSSSKSNDVLSALHNLDILTPGGAGVVPLAVNDRNGTSLLAAPECWIDKFPDLNMGKQAEAREWVLTVVDYRLFVGGT